MGGIRTPETLARLPVFKTGAFNHSATHPALIFNIFRRALASTNQELPPDCRGDRGFSSTKRILASRSALAWRSCSIASSIATVTFAIPSSNAVTLQAGHAKQEGDLVVNVVERHRWLGSGGPKIVWQRA